MQTVYQLIEIMDAYIIWNCRRTLVNAVKHNRHHHCARHGIGRSPLGFEILTRIVDIGMGCIQWIERSGCKIRRQSGRSQMEELAVGVTAFVGVAMGLVC